MNDDSADESLAGHWDALEAEIDRLIERNVALARENAALHRQQKNWLVERATLIRKHELAKSGLEAMINRLKALEPD